MQNVSSISGPRGPHQKKRPNGDSNDQNIQELPSAYRFARSIFDISADLRHRKKLNGIPHYADNEKWPQLQYG
jgi:hypothetical protein